jgi:hypothetical protein
VSAGGLDREGRLAAVFVGAERRVGNERSGGAVVYLK